MGEHWSSSAFTQDKRLMTYSISRELEAAFIAEEQGFLDLCARRDEEPTLANWEDFLDHKRLLDIQDIHELDEEPEVITDYFIRRFQEQW